MTSRLWLGNHPNCREDCQKCIMIKSHDTLSLLPIFYVQTTSIGWLCCSSVWTLLNFDEYTYLLAFCWRNQSATCWFLSQGKVMRSFDFSLLLIWICYWQTVKLPVELDFLDYQIQGQFLCKWFDGNENEIKQVKRVGFYHFISWRKEILLFFFIWSHDGIFTYVIYILSHNVMFLFVFCRWVFGM